MSPHWSPAYNWVWEPPIKVDTARWTQKTHQPLHRVGPRSSLFPQWSVSTHTHSHRLSCSLSMSTLISSHLNLDFKLWIWMYFNWIHRKRQFDSIGYFNESITTDVDWHLVIEYMKMYFKACGIHMSSTINVWNLTGYMRIWVSICVH